VAKNYYFENYENSMEQTLIEDLVVESIKIYGIDTMYLPRTLGAKDDILNEDDLPLYSDAYEVEMYVKNVDGFEGEGDFLSKFGLQIRDSMTLTIAMRTYELEVGINSEINRPREGDIIYMPINKKMFVIQHVEHESIFYQMGSLQTYDLRCELFEYSGERFDTGFPYLDDKFESDNLFIDSDGTTFNVEVRCSVFHMVDTDARGDLIETPKLEARVDETIIFDQSHSSNTNWPLRIYTTPSPNSGLEITAGVTVTGTPGVDGKLTWTPNATGTYHYINPTTIGMGDTIVVEQSKLQNVEIYDTIADNTSIETIGDNILDFTQNNPFGEDNF
jgi:hypothetical protein